MASNDPRDEENIFLSAALCTSTPPASPHEPLETRHAFAAALNLDLGSSSRRKGHPQRSPLELCDELPLKAPGRKRRFRGGTPADGPASALHYDGGLEEEAQTQDGSYPASDAEEELQLPPKRRPGWPRRRGGGSKKRARRPEAEDEDYVPSERGAVGNVSGTGPAAGSHAFDRIQRVKPMARSTHIPPSLATVGVTFRGREGRWRVGRKIEGVTRYPTPQNFQTRSQACITQDLFLLSGAKLDPPLTAWEARCLGLNFDLGVHQDPRVARLLEGTDESMAFVSYGKARSTIPEPGVVFAAERVEDGEAQERARIAALLEECRAMDGPAAMEGDAGVQTEGGADENSEEEGDLDRGVEDQLQEDLERDEGAAAIFLLSGRANVGSGALQPAEGPEHVKPRVGGASVRPAQGAGAGGGLPVPRGVANTVSCFIPSDLTTIGVSYQQRENKWRVRRSYSGVVLAPSPGYFRDLTTAAIQHDLHLLQGGGSKLQTPLTPQEARCLGLNFDLGVHNDPRVARLLEGTDPALAFSRLHPSSNPKNQAHAASAAAAGQATVEDGPAYRTRGARVATRASGSSLDTSPSPSPSPSSSLDRAKPQLGQPRATVTGNGNWTQRPEPSSGARVVVTATGPGAARAEKGEVELATLEVMHEHMVQVVDWMRDNTEQGQGVDEVNRLYGALRTLQRMQRHEAMPILDAWVRATNAIIGGYHERKRAWLEAQQRMPRGEEASDAGTAGLTSRPSGRQTALECRRVCEVFVEQYHLA